MYRTNVDGNMARNRSRRTYVVQIGDVLREKQFRDIGEKIDIGGARDLS